MDYEAMLNALNNMVVTLSDEVKQLRLDNSRLKDEIRLLRADIVLRNPQEYDKTIENMGVLWHIGEKNKMANEDVIDYYNNLAAFGNDLNKGESPKTK